MSNSRTTYIGIDVSKKTLDIYFLSSKYIHMKIENNDSGFDQLISVS